MNVEQMRDVLVDVYSHEAWKNKVARMPENQVIALYFKFNREGVIDGDRVVKQLVVGKRSVSPCTDDGKPDEGSVRTAVQCSIFDMLEAELELENFKALR